MLEHLPSSHKVLGTILCNEEKETFIERQLYAK